MCADVSPVRSMTWLLRLNPCTIERRTAMWLAGFANRLPEHESAASRAVNGDKELRSRAGES